MPPTGSQFEAHEALGLHHYRRPQQPQQLYHIELQQQQAASPGTRAQHWRSKSVPDAVVRQQQQREQQQQQQILLLQQQQQQLLSSLMMTRDHHKQSLPATSTLRPRRTPSFHYQPAVSAMMATSTAGVTPAVMIPSSSQQLQHQTSFASQAPPPRTSTLRRSKTNAEDFSGLRNRSSSKLSAYAKPQHHQLGLPASHALLAHWPSIDGVTGHLLLPPASKPVDRTPKKSCPLTPVNTPPKSSVMYPARSMSYLPETSPQQQQPNLGSSLDLLYRRWSQSCRDVRQPLHVDCSVEYDLGSHAKVPKDSAPLLIIHPGYQKRLSVASGGSPPPKRFHPYSSPGSGTAPATVTSSQNEARRSSMEKPSNSSSSSAFAHPGRGTRLFTRHQSFLLPTSAKPDMSFLGNKKTENNNSKASASVVRSKSHRTKDQSSFFYPRQQSAAAALSQQQHETAAMNWLQKTSTPASASALHLSLTNLNFPGSIDTSAHDRQLLRQLAAASSGDDSGAGSSNHSAVGASAAAAAVSVYCDSGLGTPSAIHVVKKSKNKTSLSSSASRRKSHQDELQVVPESAKDGTDGTKWTNSLAGFMSGFLCCAGMKSDAYSPNEVHMSEMSHNPSSVISNTAPVAQAPLVLQQQQSVLSDPWTTASSGIHSAAAASSLSSSPSSSSPSSPGGSSISNGSWNSWPSDPIVMTPPYLGGRFPPARRCPTCQLSGEDCNDGFCRAVWMRSKRMQQRRGEGVNIRS